MVLQWWLGRQWTCWNLYLSCVEGYWEWLTNSSIYRFNTLVIATLLFLFLNRSKRKRRPRSLDGELKELIATDQENKGIALDIKNYLLWIIECNNNDEEKFNDLQLAKAQEIIDRAGPAAFYWMSDIAAQLALLSAAQINGIPTNVNVELGASATAGDVVRVVVKG